MSTRQRKTSKINMGTDICDKSDNQKLIIENEKLRQDLEEMRKLVHRLERHAPAEPSPSNSKKILSSPIRISSAVSAKKKPRKNSNDDRLSDKGSKRESKQSDEMAHDGEPRKSNWPEKGNVHTSSDIDPENEDVESGIPSRHEKESLLQDDNDLVIADHLANDNVLHDEEGLELVDELSSFGKMVMDRAGWLVGLLVLQSMSSFIIQRNESLLQKHLVIVRFLTMLVGAGGNAGNQASVRVIRGLAVGKIRVDSIKPYLINEFSAGLFLSIILGVAGCIRAAAFLTPFFRNSRNYDISVCYSNYFSHFGSNAAPWYENYWD